MCGNSTNCHTFTSQAVSSTGCFLQWLKLSASVCCKIEVSAGCLKTFVSNIVWFCVSEQRYLIRICARMKGRKLKSSKFPVCPN